MSSESYPPANLSWAPDRIEGRSCCLLPVPGRNGEPPLQLHDLQGMGVPARGIPIEFRPISRNGWTIAMDKGHLSLVERPGAMNRHDCQLWLETFSEKMVSKLVCMSRDSFGLPFTMEIIKMERVTAGTNAGGDHGNGTAGAGQEGISMADPASVPLAEADESALSDICPSSEICSSADMGHPDDSTGSHPGSDGQQYGNTAAVAEEEKICGVMSCSGLIPTATEVSTVHRTEVSGQRKTGSTPKKRQRQSDRA